MKLIDYERVNTVTNTSALTPPDRDKVQVDQAHSLSIIAECMQGRMQTVVTSITPELLKFNKAYNDSSTLSEPERTEKRRLILDEARSYMLKIVTGEHDGKE